MGLHGGWGGDPFTSVKAKPEAKAASTRLVSVRFCRVEGGGGMDISQHFYNDEFPVGSMPS